MRYSTRGCTYREDRKLVPPNCRLGVDADTIAGRMYFNLLRTGLVDISTTSVSYYFGIVSGVILYVEYRKHRFIILKSIFNFEINISNGAYATLTLIDLMREGLGNFNLVNCFWVSGLRTKCVTVALTFSC